MVCEVERGVNASMGRGFGWPACRGEREKKMHELWLTSRRFIPSLTSRSVTSSSSALNPNCSRSCCFSPYSVNCPALRCHLSWAEELSIISHSFRNLQSTMVPVQQDDSTSLLCCAHQAQNPLVRGSLWGRGGWPPRTVR